MNKRSYRRRRRGIPRGYVYVAAFLVAAVILVGLIIGIVRYTPTKEHLSLSEYYSLSGTNQAAVMFEDQIMEVSDDLGHAYALIEGKNVYLEIGFVKEYLDDGFVYDDSEVTLRYATDSQIFTTVLGTTDYTVDKSNEKLDINTMVAQDDTVYVAVDYLKLLTDFECTYYASPARVLIERAGYEKEISSAKAKTQIRKLNGPKSPILEDVEKGEKITKIRETGKWSFVVSEKGVMGYMRNNKLSKSEKVTVSKKLPERNYNHIKFGSDICMGWQQVTNQVANQSITDVLAKSGNINVISPTWFYLNNNNGGIASLASSAYVDCCHQNNVQVWALVSNFEDDSVDTEKVLNSTSSRDNLVNNLIVQAIKYGFDGINVDFEELPGAAADGYIQFIKELSIKCENNDIILSVDNYVPDDSNACYNRKEQAKYADYVIIMGYDEHYAGSEEAGSVASYGWVKQGIENTLNDVPANQVVLGIPFYGRAWEVKDGKVVSSSILSIASTNKFLSSHSMSASWDDEVKQKYAESVQGDTTTMVWAEDAVSIEEKLKLLKSENLAGGAFWKLGLENSDIWNVVVKYL